MSSATYILYICLFVHLHVTVNSFIVSTGLGQIEGSVLKTWKEKEFHAFRGIRFGEPPIGNLRFKDPIPVQPWYTVFNATIEGPMCPQPDKFLDEMSEDCLRINVYTHSFDKKSPVLLYIHGGGLYAGSGLSTDYGGPNYLMEHDIVLVTFNYRLATLGFLSLGDAEYPGNAGFKDQVLAMRWVQDHIHNFGGDPKRVTLIGNSAGAFSIALHAVSPMSEGLFHQAILGSGAASLKDYLPQDQKDVAETQAKLFGCEQNGILKCLQETSMEKYVNTTYAMFPYGIVYPWSFGVLEADFGQERFLVEDPIDSFQEGRFRKFPIIIGATESELTAEAYGIITNTERADLFTNSYEIVYPPLFYYEEDTNESKHISKTLREFYELDTNLTLAELTPLANLLNDGILGFSAHRFTRFMQPFENVYSYKFSYVGRYSHFYYPKPDTPYGAVHSDDFIYLFVRNRVAPVFKPTDIEAPTIERLTRLYTNFVKTGNPNNETDLYIGDVVWRKLTSEKNEHLNIGSALRMEAKNDMERFDLWDSLFPIGYPKSGSTNVRYNGIFILISIFLCKLI